MRRKRKISAVLIVFVLAMQVLALASSPASAFSTSLDWAYSAIEELGQGRDIPGFELPDTPNRNQAALLIARLLQHLSGEDHAQSRRFGVSQSVYLDSMIFSYNQRVAPERAFTANQVELLYRLVLEFDEELEILGYAIQDFKHLYAQSSGVVQTGLFTERKLLYSEQVLSAARRGAELNVSGSNSTEASVESKVLIEEIVPEPIGPRNLWTGQFTSPRILPPSSSFVPAESLLATNPSIQIGGLEVSGSLRASNLGSQSMETSDSADSEEAAAGYGVSMRVGDVALSTAVDLGVDSQLVPKSTSTSVDLSWDWADLFTLSAGVRLRDSLTDEGEKPLTTSLGIIVPINEGQMQLGMTQQWKSSVLEGDSLGDDESTTTELELSYRFKNDSSLRFNYRFIDFSGMEPGTEAEAAFSIKF